MLPHGFLELEAVGMTTHRRAYRNRFRDLNHSYLAGGFQILQVLIFAGFTKNLGK